MSEIPLNQITWVAQLAAATNSTPPRCFNPKYLRHIFGSQHRHNHINNSSILALSCVDSVISFSPCLPYISAPPNDLSDEPSSQCCDIFAGAFDSDEAECLCYLVRQNTLLGFPLNVTKLLSLSDLCSLNNNNSSSLESIISGSPTLPPLIVTLNKPPSSDSNARRLPPPPPRHTLHRPPPSTLTRPRPPASTLNITKPSASGLELTNAAYIWCFLFGFLYFRI